MAVSVALLCTFLLLHAHAAGGQLTISSAFHTVAKLPSVRSDLSVSQVGSKFYLVGGCVGKQVMYCPEITAATTVFDAAGYDFNTFGEVEEPLELIEEATEASVYSLSDAPAPRYRHASAVVANQQTGTPLLFLLGGRDLIDNLMTTVDVLDIANDDWWTLGTFAQATSDLAAFAHNTHVFLLGGYSAFYEASSSLWRLDVSSISLNNGENLGELPFELMEPMPTARGDIAIALLGEAIVALGGFNHEDWCNPLTTAEAYDVTSDEWVSLPPMPTGRSDKGVTVKDGSIYVFGGENNVGCLEVGGGSLPVDEIEVYTPDANGVMSAGGSWQDYGELPVDMFRFQAGSYDDEIFLFGGQLLDQLADGTLEYPLTDNITVAYFVPLDTCVDVTTGDANQDGEVSVLDVVLAINFILQLAQITGCGFMAADMDSNDDINVLDVVAIVDVILQAG